METNNNHVWRWLFLMPSKSYSSRPEDFERETNKDINSISQEFNAKHKETTHNHRLSTDRDLALSLNIPHHFDLKLKAVTDILDLANPNPAFSLKQNAFVLDFLNALEKPLIELKASLGEDQNKHLAFNLIEKQTKERLRDELSTLRDSNYVNNKFSAALAVNDNLERDFSLDKNFKEINSKLLRFGLEDLAAEAILRRIDKANLDEPSIDALNSFRLHKDDFKKTLTGQREDKHIFNNPFLDKEYEALIESIYTKDIQASKFIGVDGSKIKAYIDFSEKLLRSLSKSLSDDAVYEQRVKNKIIDKLDQISFKVDLNLKDFKKLINIIDENRSQSTKALPSVDEYFHDKLNQVLKERFSENKITKLNLNTDQFVSLIHEHPEFRKDAESFLLKSLQSVNRVDNFIGLIKSLADLKIPLNQSHKEIIKEFMLDNKEGLARLSDSHESVNQSLAENFILAMRSIYDKDFSIEALKTVDLALVAKKELQVKTELSHDTNIMQELSRELVPGNTPISRLEKNPSVEKEGFLKLIRDFFTKINSASVFQENIKQLENLITYNPKINAAIKREAISAAFETYLSASNRSGELDCVDLEKQKESILRSIF